MNKFLKSQILIVLLLIVNGCQFQENKGESKTPSPTDSVAALQHDETRPSDAAIKGKYSENSNAVIIARDFLRKTFKEDLNKNLPDSASRKFLLFEYDLNGDSKNEIFVGLRGSYFCGSGGCTWYLLHGDSETQSKFTVTQYPIYISKQKNEGWHNLLLESDGYHRVKFANKKFPGNPSMLPTLKTLPAEDILVTVFDLKEGPYQTFDF